MVDGVVAEKRVGLYGLWRIECLAYAVCLVGRDGMALQASTCEYHELAALVTTAEDDLSVGIIEELECYLVEYGCYVVLAHTLKVGQA